MSSTSTAVRRNFGGCDVSLCMSRCAACAGWLRPALRPAQCPTTADSNLAFVCDLGNRGAVEKLLTIKRSKGSQRMSILCRNLQVRGLLVRRVAGRGAVDSSRCQRCQDILSVGLILTTCMLDGPSAYTHCNPLFLPVECCVLACTLPPALLPLQDVDTYTLGWPPSRAPGQPDMFKLVRRVLPGPVRGEGRGRLRPRAC